MIAKIWYNRILDKTRTFAECPERYQDAVKALFKDAVINFRDGVTAAAYEDIIGEAFQAEE